MNVYLFSVQVLSTTSDPWQKRPLLFFVDETGRRHTCTLRDYAPYVLLKPNREDISVEDVESCLQSVSMVTDNGREIPREIPFLRVEEHTMTPLVGFTNNRQDRVFRVYYEDLAHKYRLMKRLETELDTTVLHRRYGEEIHLLHATGWRLQSWFRLTELPTRGGTICVKHMVPLAVAPMAIPPMSYAYIRMTIRSSTATPSNLFAPTHTIRQDVIQACELRVGRLDRGGRLETTHLEHADEKALIRAIQRWFVRHDPCVLVHMSDPIDHLAFLHFRAKQHKIRNPGLSALQSVPCVENTNMDDEQSFRDLSCPGREVVDLLHVLQKFMISPNLDGYTLADAFAHPKLIRSKETIVYSGDDDATLQPLGERRQFISRELDVMCALQSDNSFIINNLALSASCDLSLFKIISRGQQARAFACFARAYYRDNIYINHVQFETPYLLVKRSRAESSYPDPPWLDNPPLDALRGAAAPVPPTTRKRKHRSVAALFGRATAAPAPKKTEKRFGGGFVITPSPGFYHRPWEAVVTLDFASLYPSIMEGYSVCFRRVCYDPKWLEDDRAEKEYVPLDDTTCCVFIKSYDQQPVSSITDRIIHDVMQNRKQVRAEIRRTTDPFLRQSLDAQQLCCKILQNAFYGACGSETFAIPCTAIAASVCMIGQWMNKTVRHRAMIRNGRCVYGDTDSVMVQFPTDPTLTTRDAILADVYRQGHELAAETTALFPAPNAVEFETVKLPHLQTSKKKTYAAREYPPSAEGWNQAPTPLFKGFAFKKRDRCPFVYKIGRRMMEILMENQMTDAAIVQWVGTAIDTDFTPTPDESRLADFVITCRLGLVYKQEAVLALALADQYERELGARPRPGRRLRYLIATFDDGRKHFQSSVTPASFVRTRARLDTAYYLEKQLLLPLKQILDLRPTLFKQIERMIGRKVMTHTIRSNRILSNRTDL